MTMIVVTHEMGFSRDVADRCVFMDDGYFIEQGPPENLFFHPKDDRTKRFLRHILPERRRQRGARSPAEHRSAWDDEASQEMKYGFRPFAARLEAAGGGGAANAAPAPPPLLLADPGSAVAGRPWPDDRVAVMTPRIAPIMPSRRWEVLPPAELDRIREAIFTVLAAGRRALPPAGGPRRPRSPRRRGRPRRRRSRACRVAWSSGPGGGAQRFTLCRPRPGLRLCPRRTPLPPVQRRQRRVRGRAGRRLRAGPRRWPTWPTRRASSTRCPRSPSPGGRSSPPTTCRPARAPCTRRRRCWPTRASTFRR